MFYNNDQNTEDVTLKMMDSSWNIFVCFDWKVFQQISAFEL